ncbi:MAG: ARMT1-like domain-containing protein [Clostridiales bacterium]|nr:ARMT1-like domain-containing protein [Clostridiales bacterium]MDD7386804.1 ARMT1-like domain-containing protein [Bacillota bacterium]
MSVALDSGCMECHLRRNLETARGLGTEEQATAFAKALMKLYLDAPEGVSTPWLAPHTAELFRKMYGLDADRFRAEKEASNRFVLSRLDQIRRRAQAAPDPVYAGLQFAILGNYLDFSALQGEVSFEELDELLAQAEKLALDPVVYRALCADLARGGKLLYLTDNAGEIGFDRVLADQIHRAYPRIAITFCVRGGPAVNDATRADAAAVGISFPVIDNGNRIPGTQIDQLGAEARRALDGADVILSKGQGNVETLRGCGRNIYYAFLIKCARFERLFGKPKFTPMLVRERA